MTDCRLFAAIAKTKDRADGTIDVWGFASTGARDSQGEIITPEAMKAALPAYMEFGAVREMHQPSAVGTALDAEVREDGATWFGAHIVDPVAVKKVKHKVFKGFSVGGRVTARDDRDSTVITALDLAEVSLVDRPANPEAVITVMKRDDILAPQENAAMQITNEMIVEKAKALAEAAGNEDIGAFLDRAKTDLEKGAALAAETPALDPDAVLKAARAKVVQKWTASDGTTFNTKDDAVKHEAGIARDPAADKALADAKALLAKAGATFTESTSPTSGLTSYALEGTSDAADGAKMPAHATVNANQQGTISSPSGTSARDKAKAEDEAKRKKAEEDEAEEKRKAEEEKAEEKRKTEAEEKAKAKKGGDAPGDGKKPYGDVEYADPGYQADKKKRYPLDTEAHIRAAWSYIAKPKNAKKYSSEHLKSIKAKIVAAWKAKIDKDGPPSASEDKDKKKAAIAENVRKDMGTVARLACLIQELEWLHECVEREEMYEEDTNSTLPSDLKEDIARICATLKAMVDEETGELLNDEETEDFGELLELAVTALPIGNAAALAKVIEGARLAKAENIVLKRLGELRASLAKIGRRHNRADSARIQSMHDHTVSLGAKCAVDGAEKAAENGDLAKSNEALKAQVGEMSAVLGQLTALVTKIAEQPAATAVPARLTVVEKNEDVSRELTRIFDQPATVTAHELIKAAIQRPLSYR